MDFPSITNLVTATFSEMNSHGVAGSADPNDAAQPLAHEGGFGSGSDTSSGSNMDRDAPDQSGYMLNTKA